MLDRATAIALLVALLLSPVSRGYARQPAAADPLPSWNEGPAKAAILAFVRQTTSDDSPDLVPESERIAVFDNDGTLWPENPAPVEVAFTLERAKNLLAQKPELASEPAYKALAGGDAEALMQDHRKNLLRLVMDTHAGQTTEEFETSVADWFATARHPRFNRRYVDCTYEPMQEVLRLLRAPRVSDVHRLGRHPEFPPRVDG